MAPALRHDPSVGNPERYRERQWVCALVDHWPAGPAPQQVVVVSCQRQSGDWAALAGLNPARALVLALGGEHGRPLPWLQHSGLRVAQCYLPPTLQSRWRTRLPLGPSGFLPRLPPVPWADRDVPLSFVGWLHPRRSALYRLVSGHRLPGPLPSLLRAQLNGVLDGRVVPGSVLRFGERFGHGLDSDAYAQVLRRTQVALCPPGTRQDETFRHWEAARSGCVLVGARVPGTGPPVLPMPSTAAALTDLLSSPDLLKHQHARVGAWWAQSGRPAQVAASLAAWWAAG